MEITEINLDWFCNEPLTENGEVAPLKGKKNHVFYTKFSIFFMY
jgi:hypothetical protein